MTKLLPVIDDEGEIRELSKADMKLFRPAKEVLAPELYSALVKMNQESAAAKKVGRPLGSGSTKQIAMRINDQALALWRASGKGWQTRAAALLAKHAPRVAL